jgi:hypothetical protein
VRACVGGLPTELRSSCSATPQRATEGAISHANPRDFPLARPYAIEALTRHSTARNAGYRTAMRSTGTAIWNRLLTSSHLGRLPGVPSLGPPRSWRLGVKPSAMTVSTPPRASILFRFPVPSPIVLAASRPAHDDNNKRGAASGFEAPTGRSERGRLGSFLTVARSSRIRNQAMHPAATSDRALLGSGVPVDGADRIASRGITRRSHNEASVENVRAAASTTSHIS